jgi:hypothetical protein
MIEFLFDTIQVEIVTNELVIYLTKELMIL